MDIFLKGIIIALAISIPMGAVSLLGVQRTITKGKNSGIFTGLGAILADVIFGIIATFGLTVLANLIDTHKEGLGIFGAFLILYVGINIFFSKPQGGFITEIRLPPVLDKLNEVKDMIFNEKESLSKDFVSGFMLTITNPLTLVALLALLAWFGIDGANSDINGALLVIAGLVVGSIIWWAGLISVVSFLKTKIKIPSFKIVNKIFGVILIILAFLILVRVL